jgi:hypothetical protein
MGRILTTPHLRQIILTTIYRPMTLVVQLANYTTSDRQRGKG